MFQEQQRANDRSLKKSGRDIERERAKLEQEEKKIVGIFVCLFFPLNFYIIFYLQELEIKKNAQTGNKEACTVLAKQLIQLRKQKNRTYAASSKVSIL